MRCALHTLPSAHVIVVIRIVRLLHGVAAATSRLLWNVVDESALLGFVRHDDLGARRQALFKQLQLGRLDPVVFREVDFEMDGERTFGEGVFVVWHALIENTFHCLVLYHFP